MTQLKRLIKKNKRLLPFVIIGLALAAAVVIVMWPNGNSPKPVSCPVQSTDFDCWAARYRYLVVEDSTKAAFDDLKEVYEGNDFVRAQCHQLTHVIGRQEAAKHDNVGQTYTQGDSFCWSGFYHGAIEAFATRYGSEKFVTTLNDICTDLRNKSRYSFEHYNCVHGLGHGIMAIKDNELFISLGDCDTIRDSWERTSCYGGAFMENIMSNPATNKEHTTKYLDPNQPMYPCNAVGEQYKEQCYLMQTSYALTLINSDFGRMFELCSQVEINHRSTCYQSIGRDASGNTVSDVAQTNTNCSKAKSEEQLANCAVGAVKDFISYYHDDQKAKEFCNSFSQQNVTKLCLDTAQEYYKSF